MARKDVGECVKVGRSLNCALEWKFGVCVRMGVGNARMAGHCSNGLLLHLMALVATECDRGMGSECCERVWHSRK